MALRIRRGTKVEREANVFDLAEPIWDTTDKKLFVGDGTTLGGIDILASASSAVTSVANKTGAVTLGTDDVIEQVTHQYFTPERAIQALGDHLENVQHVGMQFVWNSSSIIGTVLVDETTIVIDQLTGKLTLANPSGGDGVGILNVEEDTTPSLGGNLDLNSFGIIGTGTITATSATTTLTVKSSSTVNPAMKVQAIASSAVNGPMIALNSSRGTITAPDLNNDGDNIGGIRFSGAVNLTGGAAYEVPLVIVNGVVTNIGNGTTVSPESKLVISVSNGFNPGDRTNATFDHTGTLTAPTFSAGDGTASNPSITFTTDGSVDTGFFHPGDGVICASTDGTERVRIDNGGMRVTGFMKVLDVAGNLPSPAEAGMIVLDGSTFKGYNGSTWVTLG